MDQGQRHVLTYRNSHAARLMCFVRASADFAHRFATMAYTPSIIAMTTGVTVITTKSVYLFGHQAARNNPGE